MAGALQSYRDIWDSKPVIRAVYHDIFDRIVARCVSGRTLEIGGGIGNLKERVGNVVTTDIQFGGWMDVVADAQRLPFADETFDNIVMLDVLHHVEFPAVFFREAERVLRRGGRVIMVEPGISPGSTLFFRLLHQEPVDMSIDPLIEGQPSSGKDPYDSNQAIPTLIATRFRKCFEMKFAQLRIVETSWFAFLAYPLSGGFKPWSLINLPIARVLLRSEKYIEKLAGRWFGFRLLLVIEKSHSV